MKKRVFSLMVLLSITAHAREPTSFLDNLRIIKLNKLKECSRTVLVAYPGRISGNCKITLRTRGGLDVNKFNELFTVTILSPNAPEPNLNIPSTISYRLQPGTFQDGISIRTKDGKSIAENAALVTGPYDEIGVLVGACSKLPAE